MLWRGPRRIKGRRKWEPIAISRARVIVNREIAEAKNAAADLFDELRVKSLEVVKNVLELPNDLEHFNGDHLAHHRRISLQLGAAQRHIEQTIRVDETQLRTEQAANWMDLLRQKMETAQAKLPKPKTDDQEPAP